MKSMHYSAQVKERHSDFLVVTGRKKSLKHKLIYVTSGLILCRLGKFEYAIEPAQMFWLPFDCLSAWTIFPDTKYYEVDISARVTTQLPHESGYVTADDWILLILQKFSKTKPTTPVYQHLSYVFLDSVKDITPSLTLTKLSRQISSWQWNAPLSQHYLNDVLLAREIKKMQQSGQQEKAIISKLFPDSEVTYHKIVSHYLSPAK